MRAAPIAKPPPVRPGAGHHAPAAVHEVLRSPGQPLAAATRTLLEPRFGHDFGRVRVHAAAPDAASARAVQARAYTVGEHIVFAAGQYDPTSASGVRLLAHELAHVVQQRGHSPRPQAKLTIGAPGDALEREADAAADAVMTRGARMPALTTATVSLQRTPDPPPPGAAPCAPSSQSVIGWAFHFKTDSDELLPGEDAIIEKLKPGNRLNIHGYASDDGSDRDPDALSCRRANRIATLARDRRADCPVLGTFRHGATPGSDPALRAKNPYPPDYYRSVIIEENRPPLESGEAWLDPNRMITEGWALLTRAQQNPASGNLDALVARRKQIKAWMQDIPKTVAPTGTQLGQQNMADYRRFYDSADRLWSAIDLLLTVKHHPSAGQDLHVDWVGGEGEDQGAKLHARNVPKTARYHIDIFGEGFFPGAINIGDAMRKTTTGVHGTPVPNLIYRHFSGKDAAANKLPFADHVADLITSENGPLMLPGLAEEIARVIAPGGTIVLYNPESQEQYHDRIFKLTGGTIDKTRRGSTLESVIVVPSDTTTVSVPSD
ncbi:MAG: DUF4157 domain-containing protein [Alphaproteobacteria bacterium]|nr:DUF4157 domain-containing protein [Alphaproteobacteria bacterium]